MHAFVIPRVGWFAEQLASLLAHVEIPLVLTYHDFERRFDLFENLVTEG
jgi:hypothetical protein